MSIFSEFDELCMQMALGNAANGLYSTHPNPRVGCVIAADERIVAEGWHERAGEAHAEIAALEAIGDRARGATMYVTLEPCSHVGRTGPCADAVIAAGIARLVVAMADPNPKVSGSGLAKCRAAGIQVDVGLLEEEAEALNVGFVTRMRQGRPWMRLKLASSLDGRTAMASGESRWITGEAARADVQHWRALSSGILTGIGTVLADDPQLNVRLADSVRQPERIVLDSALRIASGAKVLVGGARVFATRTDETKSFANDVTIETLPATANGRIDLDAVVKRLAELQHNEILIECGPTLAGAWLDAGLVDELLLYLSPTMLGHEARPMAELPGKIRLHERLEFDFIESLQLDRDLRLRLRRKE